MPTTAPPLLLMRDVSKRFAATQALRGVSFEVARGQVRALIGENGAGKSTLMKVLAGIVVPDAGSMEVEGRAYAPRSPKDGADAGVAMIHQELAIAPDQVRDALAVLGGGARHRYTRCCSIQVTAQSMSCRCRRNRAGAWPTKAGVS